MQGTSTSESGILHRLRAVRNAQTVADLAAGACWTIAIAAALLALALCAETLAHMSVVARTFTAIILGVVIVGALIVFLGPPILRLLLSARRPTEENVALIVGAHYPELHDELANALQIKRLASQGSAVSYSSALIEAAFSRVAALSKDLDFQRAVDRSALRRVAAWSALFTLVPVLLLSLAPEVRSAGFRLWNFSQSFVPPPPFTFEITPGNVRKVRGDSVALTIRTIGREPQREIVLETRESDQQYPRPTVLRGDGGVFHYVLSSVKRSTEYFAEAKAQTSATYTIDVTDRPEVRSLHVHLSYPSYTHAAAIDQDENAGDIVGTAGTDARFHIVSNKGLASAAIEFQTDTTGDSTARTAHASINFPLDIAGATAQGVMTVRRNGTYIVRMRDSDGVENSDPIVYHVTALRDESPTIRILQPQAVTEITEATRLGIVARIHDDFGFSRLVLHYRLTQSKWAQPWTAFKELSIPLTAGVADADVPYIWDLTSFGLVPEDAMDYYLEVFDNDIVNGPKSAKSEMYSLHLPSLEAALHASDQAQSSAEDDLHDAEQAAEQLKQEMEKATQELRQQTEQKNLSWQQQKKLQDVLKKQEQLQSKIDQAQQHLEESLQQLQSKQTLSPETMQKYLELQKLFQEMKSPELMQAMKRLQDAMQKLTPDQMRAAMKNFSVNEEQMKQSIERTIAMLKHIQAEQKVDELMKRADQLEKEQQQLAQKTQQAQSQEERDRLAAQQRDLEQRTKEMQKEFADLQKKMQELGKDMPNDEMKSAADQLQKDQPSSEMQQASQQMSIDPQSAGRHQQSAKNGLQQFQQNMASVKKKMQENEQKEAMTEMRRSLQDMIDLSQREEELKRQTERTPSNSPALTDQAAQQADNLQDLMSVVNRMMKLAKKSFAVTPEMGKELGSAMKEMQNATGNLEQRQSSPGAQNEGGAVGAMNNAATLMQQALQQMGQGQGQSGGGLQSFLQQLNKMAGEQEQINGMTQKLGNQGALSPQQQQEMQRISAQQQAVQQSLDQLKKEQQEMTGGQKNTLGDLNKIEEEMQEVIKDMRNNDVNPGTIQRQERILSRLLDAQRSTHERDFDKKREGNAGTDVARPSPAALPPEHATQTLEELLRLQEAGYSKDYEMRIKKYFEALRGASPQ